MCEDLEQRCEGCHYCEDLEQRCEGCHYCEYTEIGMICRYNGEMCPTDGTCYKTIDGLLSYQKQ